MIAGPSKIYVSSAARPLRRELSFGNPHREPGFDFANTLIPRRRKTEHANLQPIARLNLDMLAEGIDRGSERFAFDHAVTAGVDSSN
jgi:hypothetical protein